MDRNSIIGIVIIGIILFVFTYINKPSDEQVQKNQRYYDSIALVNQQNAIEYEKNKSVSNISTTAINPTISDSAKTSLNIQQYGSFAKVADDSLKFSTLENNLIKVNISNKGGRPYRVELKNYFTHDTLPLILFDGDSTVFGFTFPTQGRIISTNDLYFKEKVQTNDSIKSLSMRLSIDDSSYIEYIYTLRPDSYKVNMKVNFVGMNKYIAQNTSGIDINWQLYCPSQEKGWKNESQYSSIAYKHYQAEMDELSLTSKEIETSDVPTRLKWIAFKQQFFSSILISNEYFTNGKLTQEPQLEDSKYLKKYNSELGIPYNNSNLNTYNLAFYFGPNHYQTLKSQGDDLQDIVFLGRWIIKWINRYLVIPIFNFLNSYILSYGLIILILTLIIKLLIFPLTYKSYLSMAKMRVLKPQIDEATAKIPADKPMERQKATMALYKKVGVNPLGGCLPMLLQMPILIAMFRFFPTSIELRQESFLWATDLSTYDSIYSWSVNIPFLSSFYGNHISLFTILMTITTIITIKMSNSNQMSGQQIPGMKFMMYMMPVMFMFFLNSFSAGLTYYYFLANMITIMQNEIFRRSISEEKLLLKLNENKKKPVKKSKFQERLEKVAKERGYKMPR